MINRLDHVISWLEMVWYLKGLRGLALLSYLKFVKVCFNDFPVKVVTTDVS